MTAQDLTQKEYHEFYSTYINKVPTDLELHKGFDEGGKDLVQFFKNIPEDKLTYRYAEGKWSIKEVLQHIIDNERVFMSRCFRIARHDTSLLPGYEQDNYINPSHGYKKSLDALLEEYEIGRQCFIVLLKSLEIQDLLFVGNVNDSPMSARATAFITLGHERHHIDVITARYL